MSVCRKCGPNRYTIEGAQRTQEDCLVNPGFGIVYANQSWVGSAAAALLLGAVAADLDVLECPPSQYGAGGQVNSTCVPCPGGRSGEFSGASNSTECNCKCVSRPMNVLMIVEVRVLGKRACFN